jgi:hypothetical protein
MLPFYKEWGRMDDVTDVWVVDVVGRLRLVSVSGGEETEHTASHADVDLDRGSLIGREREFIPTDIDSR